MKTRAVVYCNKSKSTKFTIRKQSNELKHDDDYIQHTTCILKFMQNNKIQTRRIGGHDNGSAFSFKASSGVHGVDAPGYDLGGQRSVEETRRPNVHTER